VAFFLGRVKRRTFIQIGLFCMGLAMFGFASTTLVKDNITQFLIFTFMARFLQGFSSSAI